MFLSESSVVASTHRIQVDQVSTWGMDRDPEASENVKVMSVAEFKKTVLTWIPEERRAK